MHSTSSGTLAGISGILPVTGKLTRISRILPVLAVVLLCCTGRADGQELPVYQLYLHHPALVNPAIIGSGDCSEIKLIDRHQWIGAFNGAPKTQVLAAETSIPSKEFRTHGLGLQVVNDANGAFRQLAASFGYAYHIALDRAGSLKLGFGLAATVRQNTCDERDFSPIYDPSVTRGLHREIRPDASTGVYLQGSRFFAGLSAVQLLASGSTLDANRPERGYFAGGGYSLPVSGVVNLQPGLMVKYLSGEFQSDLNVRATYRESYRVMLSYRHAWWDFPGSPAVLLVGAGMDYRNFSFGYAYEAGLTSMQKYGYGSHEFMVGYRFCPRRRPCPAYL
jgi:type IX secretion system PorP/SprF family membrane protein